MRRRVRRKGEIFFRVGSCRALALLLMLSACATGPRAPDPRLTPVSFTDLPGWAPATVEAARPALLASCARLLTLPPDRSLGASGRTGRAGDWQPFCLGLGAAPADLSRYLGATLRPWALTDGSRADGLFTGYYEPEMRGSLTRHGPYQTPLYRVPPDLAEGVPYLDRAAIGAGGLEGRGLELVWLADPLDAFFVQVQGSGRVLLDTGETLRLGYAGKNNHPYVAIGRELVKQGEMTLEEVSLASLRAWLTAHPDRREAVLNLNPSYVFFRILEGGDAEASPPGAAHVPLTPGVSLAVDNAFIGYHVPVWLTTDRPALQRLMVAQDTGGAIKGVVRGDVFWGRGAEAERLAGQMRATGRLFVLLPKEWTPPARR